MEKFYSLSKKARKKIIEEVKKTLQKRKEIVFAYLYGSFLEDPSFRDVDVGVYLRPKVFVKEKDSYCNYTFELTNEIEEEIGHIFVVDVRILNETPFYFLNNVLSRGQLLFCRDEEFLGNLIERISQRYLLYRPVAEQYLRERIS